MIGDARRRRTWIIRAVTVLFFLALATLLVRYARTVRWTEVFAVIASYDAALLGRVVALVALSYLLYASYDVLGRAYTHHRLSTARVLLVAAVSYACNLNLGALVGGAGFRYRLYMRSGLRAGLITRVLAFSVATNWSGYILLAGVVLVFGVLDAPLAWMPGEVMLQALGGVLLGLVVAYLVVCARWHDRTWTMRGHEIRWPPLSMAASQIIVSAANWMTIALIVYALLRGRIPYPTVLGVMLLAAVAGAMTHVPAGLGVIEIVVLTLLGDRLPQSELLAALLAYRGLYYIGPLVLAILAYASMETRTRAVSGRPSRARRASGSAPPAA